MFFFHCREWHLEPVQYQVGFILYDPLNRLAAFELHGLRDRSRKIYVPLLALLSFDQLDLGWVTHLRPPD